MKTEVLKYSSASCHVYGKEDILLSRTSLLNEMIEDWKEFLRLTSSEQNIKMLQQHERTGRPLGSDGFLIRLEKSIGRLLKPKRPGRKPKKASHLCSQWNQPTDFCLQKRAYCRFEQIGGFAQFQVPAVSRQDITGKISRILTRCCPFGFSKRSKHSACHRWERRESRICSHTAKTNSRARTI